MVHAGTPGSEQNAQSGDVFRGKLKEHLVAYRAEIDRLTEDDLLKAVRSQLEVDISGGSGRWTRERLMEALCRHETQCFYYKNGRRPPDSLTRGTLLFLSSFQAKPKNPADQASDGNARQQFVRREQRVPGAASVQAAAAGAAKPAAVDPAPKRPTEVPRKPVFSDPPLPGAGAAVSMSEADELKLKPRNVAAVRAIDVEDLLKRLLRGGAATSFRVELPEKPLVYAGVEKGGESYLGPIVDHTFFADPAAEGSRRLADPAVFRAWKACLGGGKRGLSFWELAVVLHLAYSGEGMTMRKAYADLWRLAKSSVEWSSDAAPPIVLCWTRERKKAAVPFSKRG